jgi:hypothetical protein
MTTQSPKFAKITAIYKNEKYISIPLELVDNSDNVKLIMTLSDFGTTTTNMVKFPITLTSFIVFSKEQLNETLFIVELLDDVKTVIKKTTTKKK